MFCYRETLHDTGTTQPDMRSIPGYHPRGLRADQGANIPRLARGNGNLREVYGHSNFRPRSRAGRCGAGQPLNFMDIRPGHLAAVFQVLDQLVAGPHHDQIGFCAVDVVLDAFLPSP
jgi:hypothetical protein